MADHAPGSGPATKEPSCINCGGIGHWAVGCPEPVRAKPAGLSRRNTSTSHDHGRNGDHQHGGRRSGAVVTKYPAPPSGNPIVTRYGPPPGQPHAPPYPGPPQPYPSYPPSSNTYAPPPPGNYPSYSHYSPPPPPGAYPPPPGPPGPSGPYHYPAPSHYGGPPPGPPGPPPSSYQPPPHYPPSGSYHPPSYTSPSGYPPVPPLPPPPGGQYSAPYNPTSSGGYPPSTYGPPPAQPLFGTQPGPPPPPPSFAQPYGPPAPGYGPSPTLPGPPRGTPPGLPPIPPHRNQPPRDRNGRHRQGHNNRTDRSRRNNKHSNPKRDVSQPRSKSGANIEKHVPARVEPEPEVLKTTSVASATPEIRHANPVSEDGVDDEEADWKWEEEMIFKESDTTHQPDPIAKPLPGPGEYHDNIMLPPAWNATCIQSDFVTEENLEEFSRTIRETDYFASLQFDPAFWRSPVESRNAKQQPEPRDKPSAFKSVRLPGFPSLPPKPPTPENRDYRPISNRKRAWEDSPYKNSRVRGNQEGDEWADHRQKRHRGDSHSGHDMTSPHSRRVREDSRPIDRYRSQRLDRAESDPTEALLKSLDDPHDAGPSRRHDGEKSSVRQDSGYYSSRHTRRQGSNSSFQEEGRTPPHLGTPPPERRPQSRHASRSRSRSRHSHRRGSHSSRAESRPASRQSVASFASHGSEGSELSALEAELLGIAPKSKGGKESKHGDQKFRKRAPKVDSAYGRRW